MTKKVLIADDSQTIQKVIKITLGDRDWEIKSANNEAELVQALTDQSIDLILLDFGLSESKSGYQLCKELRAKYPKTSVIILYGTFDTIEERQLKECNASDKIVKPFDSHKFSSLCESVLGMTDEVSEIALPFENRDKTKEFLVDQKKINETKVEEHEVEDSWVLEGHANTPMEMDLDHFEEIEEKEVQHNTNPLQAEMSDWGMEVPGIIGREAVVGDLPFEELPPVIGVTPEEKPEEFVVEKIIPIKLEKENIFPSLNDLEYPDVGVVNEVSLEGAIEEESHADLSHIKLDTDFIALPVERRSMESFEDQDTPTNPQINVDELKRSETLQEKLFVEESPENFWSVDDDSHVEQVAPTPAPTVKNQVTIFEQDQLEVLIRKLVQEAVREQLQKNVEKVAWEIIPDLAEKLIAKELKNISDQVLGADRPNQ